MIELFATIALTSSSSSKDVEHFEVGPTPYPWTWIIISLLIAFGTAYLAFSCNDRETPATRFIVTFFAFLFSGIYLIYYFIVYILLNKKCNGKDISDVVKTFIK